MTSRLLPIAPSTYWLHAHGEGGGADFDLVMERDADGLPVLRGKHVAGLLRLAIQRAQAWRWLDPDGESVDLASLLMGDHGDGAPGCLVVSDACVSQGLRAALADGAEGRLLDGLFERLPSTAIEESTGVAKPKHLRTVECAVPVALYARIDFEPDKRKAWAAGHSGETALINHAGKNWPKWVEAAWPALDEVGARRTRGFGRLAWRDLAPVEEGP